jgi:CheY-like chemotaxis protein
MEILPKSVERTSRLQILLIENDDLDVQLCLRALKQEGFDAAVEIVRTQQEFTERVCSRARHYDLILSDYDLGGWTGMEAFHDPSSFAGKGRARGSTTHGTRVANCREALPGSN